MNEEEYEILDSTVNNSYDDEEDYECSECGMSGAYKVNDRNFGLLYLCSRCAMINDPDSRPCKTQKPAPALALHCFLVD